MKKLLIEYIRENDQCNYADIYDYFKDLSECSDSLKVDYLMDLLLFILQEEQKNNSYSIQKYI
jgi:hypothetical protein